MQKINYNIRQKFSEEYTHEKLCLYWYNIFKNLNNVDVEHE